MNEYLNATPTVLVFPATHADGLSYLETARLHGISVIAATSEIDAVYRATVTPLVLLPFIYDNLFSDRLLELIALHKITRIFSPVAAVYIWLENFISEENLPIQLIDISPTHKETRKFNKFLSEAEFFKPFIDQCADQKSSLSLLEITAIYRMSNNIYGESSDTKIAAMMAIFSSAPKGDVVEIGALLGKSASVLSFLARRFQTGSVLVIDPWLWATGKQHDSPETVSIHMANSWDYEKLSLNFITNILPIGLGICNYIKSESSDAYNSYKTKQIITSTELGTTNYLGKISVIHIDGNHDYIKVKLDCDLWIPLIHPGGWLILDDYLWIHGNGPRRAGDELLDDRSQDIERAFVCGKALFVKFSRSMSQLAISAHNMEPQRQVEPNGSQR